MSRSLELLTEVCGALPKTVKRMFGGYGFFAPNGGMFAGIVTDDEVILKLDDEGARSALVAEGGHAWEYSGRGKTMKMASWIVVPEAFYDDLERFGVWARRAHALVPGKLARSKGRTKKAAPAKRTTSTGRRRGGRSRRGSPFDLRARP